MLHLSDCNFIWFAEIFKDMLLFHGTNLPKGSQGSSAASKAGNRKQKQFHNLEERLGPGGRAQGSSSTRRPVMGSGSAQHQSGQQKMCSLFSSLRDPSGSFPGYQQFFFRYLLVMDSARLNSHLCDVVMKEIFALSDVCLDGPYHEFVARVLREGWTGEDSPAPRHTATHISPGGVSSSPSSPASSAQALSRQMSFISRILKLKLLGKFLGLLHFYHSWNLSVGATVPPESPLITLIVKSAALRSRVSPSTCIPFSQVILEAWRSRTLILASPWVISYMRMLAWDRSSILNVSSPTVLTSTSTVPKEHIATIATLLSILRSDEFSFHGSRGLSRNR